jgi:hypothetical protein
MKLQRKGDTNSEEECSGEGFWLSIGGISWSSSVILYFSYGFLVYLLFGEISLERDIVLVEEYIFKKLCYVFSPTRVSQDKSCVYSGCVYFSDPYA